MAEKTAEAPKQPQRVRVSGQQIMEAFGQERERMETIQLRLQNMDRLMLEVRGSMEALKAIQSAEKDGNVLIPLGAGIFTEANLVNKKVKKGLTANVFVEDDIESVLKGLQKELNTAEEGRKSVEKEFNASATNLRALEQILMQAEKAKQDAAKR